MGELSRSRASVVAVMSSTQSSKTFALCAALVAAFASPLRAEPFDAPTALEDLYFGEALYHAHQAHHFDAIERLDIEIAQHRGVDEGELDSFYAHLDRAEFSVGDLELRYRMHHRAGRAISAVLEAAVDPAVRNDATYRLARIQFHKGQADAALATLASIDGTQRDPLARDVAFLRANVLLALDRPAEAAELLEGLVGHAQFAGFAGYNLGIALLRSGYPVGAARALERAGTTSASSDAEHAIRDKANLVLGDVMAEAERFEEANEALRRVRLDGPFSNDALLRAGWSRAARKDYESAIVPWRLLGERDRTDRAVQEGLLALPYAYGELGLHGRAATLYGEAVEAYGAEIGRLEASVESVRSGAFLAALDHPEIRHSQDWVVELRRLPGAPETHYLISLMASHAFQTALQNYLDIEDLRRKLDTWDRSLDAFEELVAERRRYFAPRLPAIDAAFRKLDGRMRMRIEQRNRVAARIKDMLVAPRPELLATADEQAVADRLDRLEAALPAGDTASQARARIARLRGVLAFRWQLEQHTRLTEAHVHLRELDGEVAALLSRYDGFVHTRQAVEHGFEGYDERIARGRARIAAARPKLVALREAQGEMLERVATRELERRRNQLASHLNRARFAFADHYDRAAQRQASEPLGTQAPAPAAPAPASPAETSE